MNTLSIKLEATVNNTSAKPSQKPNGFSMIELLIVLAIMGILATLAYPSYAEYVKKTKRSDGHLALLNAAQSMERCKSTSYSYENCVLSKTTSPEGYYTLALTPAPTASTFTVVATPTGTQANDTECTSMLLDHRSIRSSTPGPANQDQNMCWN